MTASASSHALPIVDVAVSAETPPRLQQAMTQTKAQLCLDATITVYLLAYARSGAFYIDVAHRHGEIHSKRMDLYAIQEQRFAPEQLTPLLLVAIEPFDEATEAWARCAALRAMPQLWQRQIIDARNPDWLDLDALIIGFPYISGIGERSIVSHPALCASFRAPL